MCNKTQIHQVSKAGLHRKVWSVKKSNWNQLNQMWNCNRQYLFSQLCNLWIQKTGVPQCFEILFRHATKIYGKICTPDLDNLYFKKKSLWINKIRDGDRFWKKNSNLCGDTVDFTSSPPYLGQDCMLSPFNWYVAIQSPALAAQKNPQMRKNPQNPHPWIKYSPTWILWFQRVNVKL